MSTEQLALNLPAAVQTRRIRLGALALPLHYAALLLCALLMTFPFLWALAVGLSKDPSGIWRFPQAFWPRDPGWYWFGRVLNEIPFFTYVGNSLLLSLCTVLATLLLAIPAGYALAHMEFPGRRWLFGLLLATLMVPMEIGVVPNFLTLSQLGWLGTYGAAMLPNIASAFGVFMMKQYFEALPADALEAARVDGANEWQVMWRIAVPMSWPAVTTLAIFTFVSAWNDYLWPSVVLSDRMKMPLAVGIFHDLTGPFATSTSLVLAAVVLAALPVLLCFVFTQRWLLAGVMDSRA
ncbi:carbohydrate ABC transporter membrane protein 2, CUT1 family [Andreprevotia lacus DSM 23236]|jgi:putative chitobiose transport system permease protein|uniref:Carbohydrate ABC transporter membrane protein 2, CUT1 family n=1 Tax=Andreprevotia lacus DSM 23236 TaxID=1121001 RepID=A0A1W1X5E0_9NEIS|nr:carbohydrate ABC transporter permease [Andreprevotia lacus]SMC19164.1 carbohydrate ABC transporter membrane protein 2, CUT1 family [Andreprevotia lacus DSM 23236]